MENQKQVWFTSDTHFGHANIIKYCNRPYRNKHDMDNALIENWNAKVKPDDLVYHLGDFCFGDENYAEQILRRLNGNKHIILGNHDRKLKHSPRFRGLFTAVDTYLDLTVNGQQLALCHYPMLTWNGSHRGSWMLHGHCHGTLKYPWPSKIHDVGVDPNGYEPLSFDKLRSIMDKKQFVKVDHHDVTHKDTSDV